MVSRRSSTEISTNHSVTSEEGTIGEDNMPSHNDNPTFYFYGPQFLVNSKGNALNPELDLHDYEDTQNEPDIPSSIVVHSFHGGDTQQWLVHDDGKGGAALMSKHNNKYVVPTSKGGISSRDAPYFWKISKNGKGYRFGMKRPSSLCLWLVNNTAKLGDPLGIEYEPIFIFQSTSEKYTAIKKLQFMPTPEPIAQPADARIFASGGVQSNAKICNENHQALEPVFPDLALGLPSHHILDTVATGRECSGFPTGFFRIRAVGSSLYWSLHCADSGRDGNLLMLWALVDEEDSQAFLHRIKRGELCLCGGHVDVLGNALVYRKRERLPSRGRILGRTPCQLSHTQSKENPSASSSTQTHASPEDGPVPRKNGGRKCLLLQRNVLRDVNVSDFNKISRWAPTQRFVLWTQRSFRWVANKPGTLGVEEKPQLTDPEEGYPTRFRWELEEV